MAGCSSVGSILVFAIHWPEQQVDFATSQYSCLMKATDLRPSAGRPNHSRCSAGERNHGSLGTCARALARTFLRDWQLSHLQNQRNAGVNSCAYLQQRAATAAWGCLLVGMLLPVHSVCVCVLVLLCNSDRARQGCHDGSHISKVCLSKDQTVGHLLVPSPNYEQCGKTATR